MTHPIPSREEQAMKYVALVYSNPGAFEALSQTERDELMSQADACLREFTESLERATEIVAHDPAARFWAVEVRPIMDTAGAEM
jgi:hypothetical protein